VSDGSGLGHDPDGRKELDMEGSNDCSQCTVVECDLGNRFEPVPAEPAGEGPVGGRGGGTTVDWRGFAAMAVLIRDHHLEKRAMQAAFRE
jgi:hypothetical protein